MAENSVNFVEKFASEGNAWGHQVSRTHEVPEVLPTPGPTALALAKPGAGIFVEKIHLGHGGTFGASSELC
jgi:hypothetical protein